MQNLKVGDTLICKDWKGEYFSVCSEYPVRKIDKHGMIWLLDNNFKDQSFSLSNIGQYFTLKTQTAPDYKSLYEASQAYIEQLHKFINQTK